MWGSFAGTQAEALRGSRAKFKYNDPTRERQTTHQWEYRGQQNARTHTFNPPPGHLIGPRFAIGEDRRKHYPNNPLPSEQHKSSEDDEDAEVTIEEIEALNNDRVLVGGVMRRRDRPATAARERPRTAQVQREDKDGGEQQRPSTAMSQASFDFDPGVKQERQAGRHWYNKNRPGSAAGSAVGETHSNKKRPPSSSVRETSGGGGSGGGGGGDSGSGGENDWDEGGAGGGGGGGGRPGSARAGGRSIPPRPASAKNRGRTTPTGQHPSTQQPSRSMRPASANKSGQRTRPSTAKHGITIHNMNMFNNTQNTPKGRPPLNNSAEDEDNMAPVRKPFDPESVPEHPLVLAERERCIAAKMARRDTHVRKKLPTLQDGDRGVPLQHFKFNWVNRPGGGKASEENDLSDEDEDDLRYNDDELGREEEGTEDTHAVPEPGPAPAPSNRWEAEDPDSEEEFQDEEEGPSNFSNLSISRGPRGGAGGAGGAAGNTTRDHFSRSGNPGVGMPGSRMTMTQTPEAQRAMAVEREYYTNAVKLEETQRLYNRKFY